MVGQLGVKAGRAAGVTYGDGTLTGDIRDADGATITLWASGGILCNVARATVVVWGVAGATLCIGRAARKVTCSVDRAAGVTCVGRAICLRSVGDA